MTSGQSIHANTVEVGNPEGRGAFLLVCEHASAAIPEEYDDLGLDGSLLRSHIAWDPGAIEVARELSAVLDAPLVAAKFSRLLYDCNRPPDAESAVPVRSEVHVIPGNTTLSPRERQQRVERFYVPFQETLSACIEHRGRTVADPIVVTIHSFTPVFDGRARDVEIGIIHDSDRRFADALIDALRRHATFNVQRNAPYGPADGVTHTLREHAIARGLANVMIEIRNDLIGQADSQRRVAEILAHCLRDSSGTRAEPVRDRPG